MRTSTVFAGLARIFTQSLDFDPFHSCGDAARRFRCQLLRRVLELAQTRLAHVEALAQQNRALSLFSKASWVICWHSNGLEIGTPRASRDHASKGDESDTAHLSKWSLCTVHYGLNWYVEQAIKSYTAWHWNFSSMHCSIWKVAPDEQLPKIEKTVCIRNVPLRVVPSGHPVSTSTKGRFRSVCGGLPRGAPQLQFFSDLTAASRVQLALEQRTCATVVKEFDTFVSSGFRF